MEGTTDNTINKENNGLPQPGQEEVEDWDKTREDGTPATNKGEASADSNDEGNYGSFGRSHGRGLAQLMSPHAEKGKELVLSEEEEQRLATELGKWINADTNPYEASDDTYFKDKQPTD
ncbi:hypothetical protein CPB86DRAFT_767778 [Serendipita vermifera]|nr:hypothetical protein CPB86DRAFT_767778 [Serendipita vermifera]